jgi:8-oxo-dGTP pyrophosphatase MutT (NUDIX family)
LTAAARIAHSLRSAAVLVAVVDRAPGPTLLLHQRTDTVREHRGQIAFPGGAVEPGESAEDAALREAHEEVGLDTDSVAVLGRLNDHVTVTRYHVVPIVGAIGAPVAPRLEAYEAQPTEVARVFEVPLAWLRGGSRRRVEEWSWDRLPANAPIDLLRGEVAVDSPTFPVVFFDTPEGVIWGATARMLDELVQVCFD